MVNTLIVVVNYKTYDLLEQFLVSYRQYVDQDDRFLVVADVEGELVAARGYDIYPQDAWERFEENVGYAQAVNTCIDKYLDTSFDTIAIFNADTQFIDDKAFDSCVKLLHSESNIAVVGPLQVSSSGKVTHAGIFGTNTHPIHRAWMDNYPDQYRDIRDAVTVSGSAYFIKAPVWDEMAYCVGYGFLPSRLYHEETWFSYHVREHGYRVLYNGEAKMIHEWHKSVEKNQTWADIAYKESELMFKQACLKHGIECNIK